MKRMVIALTALLAAATAAAGCSSSTSSHNDTSRTIKIAILNSSPPFEYMENGKFVGFEVDLINDVAKLEHWKIQWQYMKFDAMIPALQSGQDQAAAASFFITDVRKKVLTFSDPYYQEGNAVGVETTSSIKSLDQLKGKTIVAKRGAASQTAAEPVAKQYGAKLILLEDEPSMFLALKNNTADALVDDSATIAYQAKVSGGRGLRLVKLLDSTDVGLAFAKGSALATQFDAGLAKLGTDGTLAALKSKYLS